MLLLSIALIMLGLMLLARAAGCVCDRLSSFSGFMTEFEIIGLFRCVSRIKMFHAAPGARQVTHFGRP